MKTEVAGAQTQVPYWNVNIPKEEWTAECPDYLTGMDPSDRAQLAVTDADYQPMSWEAVCKIVDENRLDAFKRVPSDLRRYRKYIAGLKQEYGSVMKFILEERVRWDSLDAKGEPFQYAEDIRILRNDWPYGLDKRIVHLVVWVKFPLEEDQSTGDLTPEARQNIKSYVDEHFVKPVGRADHVVWFKNWSALKSVHAVEHFHVMILDADPFFIGRITSGDVALADKIKGAE